MKKETMQLADAITMNTVTDTPLTDWLVFRIIGMAEPVINTISENEKNGTPLPCCSVTVTRFEASLNTKRRSEFDPDKPFSKLYKEAKSAAISIYSMLKKVEPVPKNCYGEKLIRCTHPLFDNYWKQVKDRVSAILGYLSAIEDFQERDDNLPFEACFCYDEIIDIEYLLRVYYLYI